MCIRDRYEGETLGIIGESGCGKSTFGKCLVQLHKPTSGTLEYKGENILGLKGKELKKIKKDIQMVFQDPFSSLDPRMTAGKLVEEPMIAHKVLDSKKERSERALELSLIHISTCRRRDSPSGVKATFFVLR